MTSGGISRNGGCFSRIEDDWTCTHLECDGRLNRWKDEVFMCWRLKSEYCLGVVEDQRVFIRSKGLDHVTATYVSHSS